MAEVTVAPRRRKVYSAGIRIIGDARIGGEVKSESWVQNSGAKT